MHELHFHYGWVPKLRIVVAFIFFLILGPIAFLSIRDADAATSILMLVLAVFMFLMDVLFLLGYSGVFVNSEQIASTVFGRKWKSIKWVDVTTITVTYPPNFQGGRDTMYWIGTASSKKTFASRKGRLMFTKDIRDLGMLIGAINDNAKGRNIEFSEAISGTLGGGLGKSTFKRIESLQIGSRPPPVIETDKGAIATGVATRD
ncbi:MAG TPA: hypothetical protein VL899_07950 [Alphaproteobacteria bacterium]|nr:hypothetical protein [Alphaproteobacteria bacterium]